MDSDSRLIPYFDCKIIQGDSYVTIKVPYGNLENMVRASLAHNEVGTSFEVCGMGMLEF